MLLLDMPRELRFVCHLKEILEERGLSKSELHRQSGVSMTTIRSLTSGAILERIDRGSTEKLIEALDCDFENLWSVEWLNLQD